MICNLRNQLEPTAGGVVHPPGKSALVFRGLSCERGSLGTKVPLLGGPHRGAGASGTGSERGPSRFTSGYLRREVHPDILENLSL